MSRTDGYNPPIRTKLHPVWLTVLFLSGWSAIGIMLLITGDLRIPVLPRFPLILIGTMIVSNLLSFYILYAYARLRNRLSPLLLSGGYLFAGLILILIMVGPLHNAELAQIGRPFFSPWLWPLWNAAVPLAGLAYAWAEWRTPRVGVFSGTGQHDIATSRWCWALPIGVLLLALVVSVVLLQPTPCCGLATPEGTNAATVNRRFNVHVFVGVLTAVSLLVVAVTTRCRSVVSTALVLALSVELANFPMQTYVQSPDTVVSVMARITEAIGNSVLSVIMAVHWVRLSNQMLATKTSLESIAYTDELTGIANRRHFNEYLAREWSRAIRDQQPLAILMIDIDYFKKYNDRYGHLAGDSALRRVAQTISAVLKRPSDLAARFGGEEFVIVLPNTDTAGASQIAHRINEAVFQLDIAHHDGVADGVVTVSIGVAAMIPSLQGAGQSSQSLLDHADAALYQAKRQGRHGYAVNPETTPEPALLSASS